MTRFTTSSLISMAVLFVLLEGGALMLRYLYGQAFDWSADVGHALKFFAIAWIVSAAARFFETRPAR
jgi:hypothetical protein